jgi:hypothetical protein
MSRKSKKPTTDPPKPAEPHLTVNATPDEGADRAIARALLRPSVNGARTLYLIDKRRNGGESQLRLMGLVDELSAQCAEVSKGNLGRPEAMLTAQARTLESLFQDLTNLAYNNLNNFDVAERLFRLAFKAQGQSRAIIETLGTIKNPPMVFAKQANVTTGPQQVNNGHFATSTRAGAGAREKDSIVQNELLEQINGERLETGTASCTGRSDTELETVGALNRAAIGKRQGAVIRQCVLWGPSR